MINKIKRIIRIITNWKCTILSVFVISAFFGGYLIGSKAMMPEYMQTFLIWIGGGLIIFAIGWMFRLINKETKMETENIKYRKKLENDQKKIINKNNIEKKEYIQKAQERIQAAEEAQFKMEMKLMKELDRVSLIKKMYIQNNEEMLKILNKRFKKISIKYKNNEGRRLRIEKKIKKQLKNLQIRTDWFLEQ